MIFSPLRQVSIFFCVCYKTGSLRQSNFRILDFKAYVTEIFNRSNFQISSKWHIWRLQAGWVNLNRSLSTSTFKILTFIWAYDQRFGHDRYQSFVQPNLVKDMCPWTVVKWCLFQVRGSLQHDSAELRLRQHSLATQRFRQELKCFLNRATALVTPHTLVDYGLLLRYGTNSMVLE